MPNACVEPLEDLDAPPSKVNPAGRLVLFAVLIGGIFIASRYFGPKSALASNGWIADWDTAVAHTLATGKPALVLFSADWCPACKEFESAILNDKDVQDYLRANYTLMVVDLSDPNGPNNNRALEFAVRSIPTLIRYDRSNREVWRTGALSPTELIQWLQEPQEAAAR